MVVLGDDGVHDGFLEITARMMARRRPRKFPGTAMTYDRS
jgi:hypothetical protein